MRLIITEKEISARRISGILADGKMSEGKIGKVPYFKFTRNGAEYYCVGLKGHILKVDYPKEYNNWQKVPPSDLVYAKLIKEPTLKYLTEAVRKLAKKVDEVIVATDFDREGELIGSDVVKVIKFASDVHSDATHSEPGVNPNVIVHRARFSALTPQEINMAFDHLQEVSNNLAQAGEARQDIDLVWGATLTRFISLATTMLGNQFLSVGRVQSPTLVLIAEQEKLRRSFVPEPYWQIKAIFEHDGMQFEATHKTHRFKEEDEAKTAFEKIGETGQVASVNDKLSSLKPVTPFNTTAFLSAASSLLGLSTSNAMRIAEDLYMNGFISYPRVDNTVYPDSLDLRGTLEMFSSGELMVLARKLLARGELTATRGKKQATDHPPIHPTSPARKDDMEPSTWRVYEMVARRFMATLAPEAKIAKKRLEIDVNGELFVANGSHISDQGWLEYYIYSRKKEKEVPDVREGEILKIVDKTLEAKETEPPGRYGQGRLIQLMEDLGLGTKATRHAIIKNLYDRGYVHSDPIVPTETGIAVAEALVNYAKAISTPDMTADLEHSMDEIVDGKSMRKEVVDKSRELLNTVLSEMETHKEEIATEIRNGIFRDRILGICKECGKELRILRSKKTRKRFVGCSGYPECSNSFPLPQSGTLIPLQESCAECGAPRIKLLYKRKRPWVICVNPDCVTKTVPVALEEQQSEDETAQEDIGSSVTEQVG